ncbi:MAG: (Fe-S)-binding protein [Deltaproteobacteria bacterium]|nr:(Fe-S)-binding protein [Deltaproteobacteria bacterium]
MPELAAQRPSVALFIPCYVDQLAPEVGLATATVLERLGCEVGFDAGQTCCGQPFVTSGARREAVRLARAHVERFAGADAVVCPSASCVATVRRRYADLIGEARAWRLASRTFELGEFIVSRLGTSDVGACFPHRVALLESCHGLRELELGRASERLDPEPSRIGVTETLLRGVSGLELRPVSRRDECCGFGGAFSFGFPELSARIGRDKLRALSESGAEYVTGTDVSCLLHLEGLRAREGFGPRAIHLAEILASGAGR